MSKIEARIEPGSTARGELITFADHGYATTLCIAVKKGDLGSIVPITRGTLVVHSGETPVPPGGYVQDLPRGLHAIKILKKTDPLNPHAKLFSDYANRGLQAEFTPHQ